MDTSPAEPQTINDQLRQLPAYQAMLAPVQAPAPVPLTASRVAAALMQLKDTAAILLLLSDGSLIVSIICLFGVPGLVLYRLRWRQVRGRTEHKAVMTQAVLSLLHELFWTYAFHDVQEGGDIPSHPEVLTLLYGLGASLCVAQLLAGRLDQQATDYPTGPAAAQ